MTSVGITLLLLAIIGVLTPSESPEIETYKPTRRQRRMWERERLIQPKWNRPRR